jgi:hypothetical protein
MFLFIVLYSIYAWNEYDYNKKVDKGKLVWVLSVLKRKLGNWLIKSNAF